MIIAGIEPFVTILHLDVPQALQDAYGGFLNSQIVWDFRLWKMSYCSLFYLNKYQRCHRLSTITCLQGWLFGLCEPSVWSIWRPCQVLDHHKWAMDLQCVWLCIWFVSSRSMFRLAGSWLHWWRFRHRTLHCGAQPASCSLCCCEPWRWVCVGIAKGKNWINTCFILLWVIWWDNRKSEGKRSSLWFHAGMVRVLTILEYCLSSRTARNPLSF